MIDFFVSIIGAVYNALPNSFIQNSNFIDSNSFLLFTNFLNHLNWLVPFDIASNIMAIWLPCILVYYVVANSRTVIKKLLRIFFDKF